MCLDLEEHGMNCSDDRCVLPQCINWKIYRQTVACQNGTQTQGVHTSGKDVNQPRNGLAGGHTSDERFRQHQREVREFEEVQSIIRAIKPNVNPLPVYPAADKVGSQQVPLVPSYAPTEDIENFDLEQYISIDSFVVHPEKKEDIENKYAENDHANIPIEVVPSAIKDTFHSLDESKEQIQGIQAKGMNRIFGILSEILHVLEAPMSAELEAFCVEVLQKAREDIQTKRLSSPTICNWEISELDIFYH